MQGRKGMNPALAVLSAKSKQAKKENTFISAAMKANMLLSIMALRDTFGFGPERMQRYQDKYLDLLDSYNKGYIDINDLQKTIAEEVGITIELKTNR